MKREYCDMCHEENSGHNYANGFLADFKAPDIQGNELHVLLSLRNNETDWAVTVYCRSGPNICRACMQQILKAVSIRPMV